MFLLGCEEQKEPASDFERRYVLIPIPGFGIEDFAEMLEHEDADARYLAVANLTASGILDAPSTEEEESEESKLLESLRERIRSMLTDVEPKVRAIAAHAPSNQASPESEADLLLLLTDESNTVRVEALAALANLEELSNGAVEQITPLIGDDNLMVRLHAITALGEACPQPRRDAIAQQLITAMPEREIAEQLVILDTLGNLGSDEAEKLILAKLRSDDSRFAETALALLPQLDFQKTETVLLESLSGSVLPAEELLSELSRVATDRSFEKAKELFSSDDHDQRDFGRRILEKIGTEAARVVLLDAYHRLTPEIEKALNEDPADPLSITGEHNRLFQSIESISSTLGKVPDDPAPIAERLTSGGTIEKRLAMEQLRENELFDLDVLETDAESPDFVTPLLALAESDSPILRTEALKTLGHSTDPRAEARLLKELDNSGKNYFRRAAINSALHLAVATADSDLLAELHQRRETFAPQLWTDEDPILTIRHTLEEAIAALESEWTTQKRWLANLAADQPKADRFLAAAMLFIDGSHPEPATDVLLEILSQGDFGERQFAVNVLESGELPSSHATRLREIAATEEDADLKRRLEDVITSH